MTTTRKQEKAKQRERSAAWRRNGRLAGRSYWLTPRGWNRRCSHCGHEGSVAYRPSDRKRACAECIVRLGINARESQSWRDGGAKSDPTVTIRFVDPETIRPA